MNFTENEIIAAAMIGFDMIEGPVLRWVRKFGDFIDIDFESFMMNFYLSFKGGNDGLKPRAILYDDFYIVAFSKGLELCCLFLKPRGIASKLDHLESIAESIMREMEESENEFGGERNGYGNDPDYDEIKRIVINMLKGNKMSTPEIRKYFKLTNAEVWEIMTELEQQGVIIRAEKCGRAQLWTSAV